MEPRFAVTEHPEEAEQLRAGGVDVVLVLPPGEAGPVGDGRPGRLALLVGEATDPAVRAAAGEMGRELWGRGPQVRSP